MSEHHVDEPVAVLRRWEDTGAVWHVLGHHGEQVTIGLFTCDGGEEVSRFTSRDPDLFRFLRTRASGEGVLAQSAKGFPDVDGLPPAAHARRTGVDPLVP